MGQEKPSEISRRSFLQRSGATGLGLLSMPLISAAGVITKDEPATSASAPAFVPDGAQPVKLTINGKEHNLKLEPRATLLDTLREVVHLTGTKKGCDHGQCGACTVSINGRRVSSCLTLAIACQGDEILTIEGLGTPDKMHPMQKAFVEHDAYQCGYCTSGQIVSAVCMMKEPIAKDDASVREAMSGNICRCGAYKNILSAIQDVRGHAKAKS